MFTVEASVPLPGARDCGLKVYPFGEMPVGSSFVVDADGASNARVAASQWKRRHPGWDFTSRLAKDGTRRIWRTA